MTDLGTAPVGLSHSNELKDERKSSTGLSPALLLVCRSFSEELPHIPDRPMA